MKRIKKALINISIISLLSLCVVGLIFLSVGCTNTKEVNGESVASPFGLKAYASAPHSADEAVSFADSGSSIGLDGFSVSDGFDPSTEQYLPENMSSECSYLLDLSIQGNNIDSVTYTLAGESSIEVGFEKNAWFVDSENIQLSDSAMSFSVDGSIAESEGVKKGIRISLPLSEEEQVMAQAVRNGKNADGWAELKPVLLVSNANALKNLRIEVVALLGDGSHMERSYRIAPSDDFANAAKGDEIFTKASDYFTIEEI